MSIKLLFVYENIDKKKRVFILQAAIAVGITALSSEDMYLAAGHGKCVEVFHVIGDMLCQLGKPPVRPDLGSPNVDNPTNKLEDIDLMMNQEAIANQTEVLSVKLDELDIGENSSDVVKDEVVSKVDMLEILLKLDEDKLIAFNII